MERESNSMQALCRSGCGFYGNPATDGLCSLCYKEALKKKQQPPNTSSSASTFSSPQSNLMETHTAIPTIPVISPAPSPSPSLSDNKDVSCYKYKLGRRLGYYLTVAFKAKHVFDWLRLSEPSSVLLMGPSIYLCYPLLNQLNSTSKQYEYNREGKS